jgi:hypothetical protein
VPSPENNWKSLSPSNFSSYRLFHRAIQCGEEERMSDDFLDKKAACKLIGGSRAINPAGYPGQARHRRGSS